MRSKQAVPLGEVVPAQSFELEALLNVLDRPGLVPKAEVLVNSKFPIRPSLLPFPSGVVGLAEVSGAVSKT
jgi:hypothetical protein